MKSFMYVGLPRYKELYAQKQLFWDMGNKLYINSKYNYISYTTRKKINATFYFVIRFDINTINLVEILR